jgi:acetaldehyde dehydrogenase
MIKAGIIGTGNIGTDLLLKILKTDFITPIIFAGRRLDSDGIKIAQSKNIPVTDQGIQYFIDNPNCCDIVYDCTSAIDAKGHAKIFKEQGIKVIDLTPAKVGDMCVPDVNPDIIITDDINDHFNQPIYCSQCGNQCQRRHWRQSQNCIRQSQSEFLQHQ